MELRDERWFENLFDQQHAAVMAYVKRRTVADAEDVLMDTFAAAWSAREHLPADPLPWLYRCAHHRILSRRRAELRYRHLKSKLHIFSQRSFESMPTYYEGEEEWLTILFSKLLESEAEVLRLIAWEDLSLSDIAFVLGCSNGAARTRLYRARNHAAKILGESGVALANTYLKTKTSEACS